MAETGLILADQLDQSGLIPSVSDHTVPEFLRPFLPICKSALCALGLVVLSACTLSPPRSPEPALLPEEQRESALALWKTNRNSLSTIDHWNLKGKLGVKSGSEGGSATIKWNYSPDSQRIELYGPFGGGRVVINITKESAVLKDTKGNIIKGETASEVLFKRIGWRVPFDHLAEWAKGLPGDGARDITIDPKGRLLGLVQGNWKVEYQSYETFGKTLPGLSLPVKFHVSVLPGTMEFYSRDGKYLGDELSVRIILKSWNDIQFRSS